MRSQKFFKNLILLIVFISSVVLSFTLMEYSLSYGDESGNNQDNIHINIHLSNNASFDYIDSLTGDSGENVSEIQADFGSSIDIRYDISAYDAYIYGYNSSTFQKIGHDYKLILPESVGGLTLAKTEIDSHNYEYSIVVAPKYQLTLHTDEGQFYGSPDPYNRVINVVEGSSASFDVPFIADTNRVFVGYYTSSEGGQFIPNGFVIPAKDTWPDNTLYARFADTSQNPSCIVKVENFEQSFMYSTQITSLISGQVTHFETNLTNSFDALKIDNFTSYPGTEQIQWGAGYLDIIMQGYFGSDMSNPSGVTFSILDNNLQQNLILNSFTFNGGKLIGEGFITIPQTANNILEIGFSEYLDNSVNISSNNRMPFLATKLTYFNHELNEEDYSITSSYDINVCDGYHASYVYGDSKYVRNFLGGQYLLSNDSPTNSGVPLFICLTNRFVEDDKVCIDAIIYVFQDLYNYESDISLKRDQILNCSLDGEKLDIASFLQNFEDLGKQFIFEMTGDTVEYSAVFDANGGAFDNGQNTIEVNQVVGTKCNFPVEPTKNGYKFLGWYTLPKDGEKCINTDYVYDPIDEHFIGTYYAHWEKIPVVDPEDSGKLFSNSATGDSSLYSLVLFVIFGAVSLLLTRKLSLRSY